MVKSHAALCLGSSGLACPEQCRHVAVSFKRRRPVMNRLLAILPSREAQAVLAQCEKVELEYEEVLYEPEARIRHVYFPTGSFVVLILATNGGANLEVGLIGDEGMLGAPLILGVNASPFRALVRGPGPAWRIKASSFARELGQRPVLRRVLHRYLQVQVTQLAQVAACTRFHVVEQRLARLLLMTQDRVHADNFHVTHEALAYMLGVRRVGVTTAAHALQARHLIRYHRGDISILDRSGMKAASCSCYQTDRDTYDRLFEPAG